MPRTVKLFAYLIKYGTDTVQRGYMLATDDTDVVGRVLTSYRHERTPAYISALRSKGPRGMAIAAERAISPDIDDCAIIVTESKEDPSRVLLTD